MTTKPSRTWCFTLNNYTEADTLVLASNPHISYVIYGKEVASTGTPHLQGYLILYNPQRLSYVRAILPKAHWEPSIKAEAANRRYCSKEGRVFELNRRQDQKLKRVTRTKSSKNQPVPEISPAILQTFPSLNLTNI